MYQPTSQQNVDTEIPAAAAVTDANLEIINTPHTDLMTLAKQHICTIWQSQWNNSTTKLREAISSVTEHLSLPRRRHDQVIISRLLIGHTLVTHKYLFSNEEAPTCQTCQLPDCRLTVKHILLECTATQDARNHACMPESIKEAITTYYE
ncbi:unnamed protein product [Acanthoscelides obtectus]|uniref:Uncharacterized protein n=1 Tax=Acanthoscelides obtectus TaxID=200917 RepID=A0A9P0Q8T0_ACAOB|nr:unnamed protein product [Acanthoscelides obtectus]CAK1627027.1 hypothetical protein AOBTE_LOCUS4235 [Acanthoscelides obtectus]